MELGKPTSGTITNAMTWKIENNWMNFSFYHPSENTPEDPNADRDFAIKAMSAIQNLTANAKSPST